MKGLEFERLVEGKVMECIAVLSNKSEEYATDEDRLHNFKVAAEVTGKTPIQALAGMMAKHTVSIYDMCNDEDFVPLVLWDEKITDHINYLLLLWGLVYEANITHPFDIDSNESPYPFNVVNAPILSTGAYDTVDIPITRTPNNCHCSQKKPTP